MYDATLVTDLAKTVFEIAVSERPGSVSRRRRVSRSQLTRSMEPAQHSATLNEPRIRVAFTHGHSIRRNDIAAVALASKLARIAWVTWKSEKDFEYMASEKDKQI